MSFLAISPIVASCAATCRDVDTWIGTPQDGPTACWFTPPDDCWLVEDSGERGNRRVTRTEAEGPIQVLADSFEGRLLNSPNDLAIDGEARIYFNDPCYGDHSHIAEFDDAGHAAKGVNRIDPDGGSERIIVHEVDPAEWHRSFP